MKQSIQPLKKARRRLWSCSIILPTRWQSLPGNWPSKGKRCKTYPYSDTCQVCSDFRYRRAILSVSPGVEVDAAHFLEAEVGADWRGGRPVSLEYSGFHAHVAGISQPFGHQRGIDPIATVCVESGRALHHRDGAIGERKHARDRNRPLNTIKEGHIMSSTCSERQHVCPDGGQLFREGIGGCVHADQIIPIILGRLAHCHRRVDLDFKPHVSEYLPSLFEHLGEACSFQPDDQIARCG